MQAELSEWDGPVSQAPHPTFFDAAVRGHCGAVGIASDRRETLGEVAVVPDVVPQTERGVKHLVHLGLADGDRRAGGAGGAGFAPVMLTLRQVGVEQCVAGGANGVAGEQRDGAEGVRIEPAGEPSLVLVEARPEEAGGAVEVAQQGGELAELMVAQAIRRPPLRRLQLMQDGNDLGVERIR